MLVLPAEACKGPVSGSLEFTILPGLYTFATAAKACTAAGLKLPDIDVIYSGSSEHLPRPPACALS